MHKSESTLKNDTRVILWDLELETDYLIHTR